MLRVKILGNKFGLPIPYSQGNRFIYFQTYGSRSYCPLPFFTNNAKRWLQKCSPARKVNRGNSLRTLRLFPSNGRRQRKAFSVFNSRDVVGVTNQRESPALVEAGAAAGLHLVRAVRHEGVVLVGVVGMGRLGAAVRPVAVRPLARHHRQRRAAVRFY